MRVNEHRDDGHGMRGGKYALKYKDMLDLTEEQLNILYRACAGHTGGRNPSCDTIACCWDADRLDIRRVELEPDLQWYNTEVARQMVINKDLIPLGGINLKNLNSLKKVNSVGFALLSAIKKPTNIISRLF